MAGTFCTVINCMDGRTQLPVIRYLQGRFGVEYVDTITEPGPDGILTRQDDPVVVESICRRVAISRDKHGSRAVTIVGHAHCAGNPVSPEQHCQQILRAMKFLQQKFPEMAVIGLWLDDNWNIKEIGSEIEGEARERLNAM